MIGNSCFQREISVAGTKFLSQECISCHRKDIPVIWKKFLSQEGNSKSRGEMIIIGSIQHQKRYRVNCWQENNFLLTFLKDRKFLSPDRNFCCWKVIPVTWKKFLSQEINSSSRKKTACLFYLLENNCHFYLKKVYTNVN